MRTVLLAMLILGTALLSAQNTRIEEVGKSPVEAKFAPGGQVDMDLCSGAVVLKGVDENVLRISYNSGHYRITQVKVRLETTGSRAKVEVTGCPHNNFDMTIELPKSSSLYLRMFAGDLEVWGITGNKDVQLDTGQLTIDMGDPANYAHLDASVTTGALDASPFEVSKAGLFRSFERDGPGKYRLRAHVGAGELDLR